jgi:ribonuclease HII
MKTLYPNISHNTNTKVKQPRLTQPTNSQRHIDLGTHIHAEHDMIYEFDKNKCYPSIAHHNDIMNSRNNTTSEVPNSWVLFYKTTIHVQKLDKIDDDKVHRKSIRPLSRSHNSSSHPGHQLLKTT